MSKKSWFDLSNKNDDTGKSSIKSTQAFRDKHFAKAYAEVVSAKGIKLESDSDSETKSEGEITPRKALKNPLKKTIPLSLLDKVDENDQLSVYHYEQMTKNSTVPRNEDLKDYKGIVISKDNKIVSQGFGYTPEVLITDKTKLIELLKPNNEGVFKNIKFYKSIEGFGISLYYFNGKWEIKTNKKLDAYQSSWGCNISFGEIFMKALINVLLSNGKYSYDQELQFQQCDSCLEKNDNVCEYCLGSGYIDTENENQLFDSYVSKLDTTKTYSFIVHNIHENRIVCDAPKCEWLYFIGEFKDGKLLSTNTSGIDHPEVLKINTLNELTTFVNNIDPKELQGVMVYTETQQIKIYNTLYHKFFMLRGNEYSIDKRYFQLFDHYELDKLKHLYNSNDNSKDNSNDNSTEFDELHNKVINDFYLMYPDKIHDFQTYEQKLVNLSDKLVRCFIKRYIKGEYYQLPPAEHAIMKKCFDNYQFKNSKKGRKSLFTVNDVYEVLDNETPDNILKLLNNDQYN